MKAGDTRNKKMERIHVQERSTSLNCDPMDVK